MANSLNKVELLAPAGSMEAFLGAIHAGADAVYVGGEKFSARAYADNLSTEDLCRCIRYAHLFGRKVYLTLNTLIKESEFCEIFDFVRPLYEAGLDGVILQDFGVLSFLKRVFPDLLLHASTQMAITGYDIVPWCLEHGISRIVPARELSLKELKEIRDAGIEVECFIHGAMCYSYSGMCLMSSILGGRSGNRGRCAQPCRLPYEAEGTGFHAGESYPLSLKDMCTIDYLPQLIEAGLTSFKIEGRMKRSEYAAGVTAVYRKYIDLYYAHPDQPLRVSDRDRMLLNSLYTRSDVQDGYLFRQNGQEMITKAKPGYEEVPQELLDQIRHEHLEQKLTYPVSMRAEFRENEAASLHLKTVVGTETAGMGRTYEVSVAGPVIQHAKKLPSDEQSVRKQLARLGNSDFTLQNLEIQIEGDVFLPNGMLNQLRREGISKLEASIVSCFFPQLENRKSLLSDNCGEYKSASLSVEAPSVKTDKTRKVRQVSQTGLSVLVSTPEQMKACLDHPLQEKLRYLYLTEECLEEVQSEILHNSLPSLQCVLVLPYIARSKDRAHLTALLRQAKQRGIQRILVRNLEELGLISRLAIKQDIELIADASLYCWNQEAKNLLSEDFVRITLPYELNSRESRTLTDAQTERIIYGYIPLMLSANCLYRTHGACPWKDLKRNDRGNLRRESFRSQAVLTDRLHKRFPVSTDCSYCYNTIYNSVPLSLHNKICSLQGQNYRLQFTVETAQETTAVLDYYLSWLTDSEGKKPAHFPCREFTTAHENRQVE